MNMEQALRSAENRIWLREKLNASGMIEPLTLLAARVVAGEERRPAPWTHNYCLAYSDGHNNLRLSGRRLDHYACAYADICEEGGPLSLAAFWMAWDEGSTFEGTAGEHWHLA